MADILLIDDQDRYFDLLSRAIPEHRYRGPARSWSEAQTLLSRARGRIDLVLLDVNFEIEPTELVGFKPDLSAAAVRRLQRTQGLEILGELRRKYPDLPVILMTSLEEVDLGAYPDLEAQDYTYFLDEDMVDARSLKAQIAGIERAREGELFDGPVFWGRSMAMRQLRERLAVLARGRLPVVLLGPTGTGKSLVARHFVHQRSGRPGQFVSVDLATLPKDLMAAHLFGAVRGAYTGSASDRPGAFEAANNGTLFLDEVGNLSMDAQKMLLSVLQEGVITRLGDLRERSIDVKLVVATNEDLAQRVQEGTFRADLFMRLNPATAVSLPSLAERKLDIERLLQFVLDQALQRPIMKSLVDEYRQSMRLSAGPVVVSTGTVPDPVVGTLVLLFPERVLRLLKAHPWPGNLREFAMVAENAVLFALTEMAGVSTGDRPDVVQVRPRLIRDLLGTVPASADAAEVHFDADVIPIRIETADTLNRVAQACERQYFTELYVRHQGDFGPMAEQLLGDASHARKVQLRFNQLGLKVRDLKDLLT